MSVIFVAHPYAGNVAHNVSEMRQICARIADNGDIPVCPVLFTSQFLNDDDDDQRQTGMLIGTAMMKFCDAVRVYGISPGVRDDIRMAHQLGKPIEYAYATDDPALD